MSEVEGRVGGESQILYIGEVLGRVGVSVGGELRLPG